YAQQREPVAFHRHSWSPPPGKPANAPEGSQRASTRALGSHASRRRIAVPLALPGLAVRPRFDLERPRRGPLLREPEADLRDAVPPTKTMLPRPVRFMAGMTCLAARNPPSALIRQLASKSAAVASSTLPHTPDPAL